MSALLCTAVMQHTPGAGSSWREQLVLTAVHCAAATGAGASRKRLAESSAAQHEADEASMAGLSRHLQDHASCATGVGSSAVHAAAPLPAGSVRPDSACLS